MKILKELGKGLLIGLGVASALSVFSVVGAFCSVLSCLSGDGVGPTPKLLLPPAFGLIITVIVFLIIGIASQIKESKETARIKSEERSKALAEKYISNKMRLEADIRELESNSLMSINAVVCELASAMEETLQKRKKECDDVLDVHEISRHTAENLLNQITAK